MLMEVHSRYRDFDRFGGSPGDSLADLSDLACDADRDCDDFACKHQTHAVVFPLVSLEPDCLLYCLCVSCTTSDQPGGAIKRNWHTCNQGRLRHINDGANAP